NCTGHDTDNSHQQDQDRSGQGGAQIQHAPGGNAATHQDLSLSANVPEAHLESGGQAHANAQQHHHIPDGDPPAAGGTHGTFIHGFVHISGVEAGNGINEKAADQEGQQYCGNTNAPGLGAGDGVPLDDADQWLVVPYRAHTRWASFLRLVIMRPTSSLVVFRPSTMPLTLPAQRTRIRSHSSSSTSKSSPTKMTATPFSF